MGANIHYPADLREKKMQGREIITFIVEQDGSLSGFKVIRGFAPAADAESIRVMKLSPNWNPGYQNGKAVRVQYTVPISYTLEDVTPKNKTGAVKGYNGNPQEKYTVTGFTTNQDTGKKQAMVNNPGNAHPLLYIVDGKEVADIAGVNPSDIQSVNILKDNLVPPVYKEKGKYGVVVITMKNGKLKDSLKPNKPAGLIDNTPTNAIPFKEVDYNF